MGVWGRERKRVEMTNGKEKKNHILLQEREVVTAGEEREKGRALW